MTLEERIAKLEETVRCMDRDRTEWILLMAAHVRLQELVPTIPILRLRVKVLEAVSVRMEHMKEITQRDETSELLEAVIAYLDKSPEH